MPLDSAGEFVHLLQLSISPIALISGVGLVLLSVTNRLARVIDRSRFVAGELRRQPEESKPPLRSQLAILVRRARLLWLSIAAVTVTIICSCGMVLLLSVMAFAHLDLRVAAVSLFFVAVASLLVSALLFFGDVLLALRALGIEIGADWHG